MAFIISAGDHKKMNVQEFIDELITSGRLANQDDDTFSTTGGSFVLEDPSFNNPMDTSGGGSPGGPPNSPGGGSRPQSPGGGSRPQSPGSGGAGQGGNSPTQQQQQQQQQPGPSQSFHNPPNDPTANGVFSGQIRLPCPRFRNQTSTR